MICINRPPSRQAPPWKSTGGTSVSTAVGYRAQAMSVTWPLRCSHPGFKDSTGPERGGELVDHGVVGSSPSPIAQTCSCPKESQSLGRVYAL